MCNLPMIRCAFITSQKVTELKVGFFFKFHLGTILFKSKKKGFQNVLGFYYLGFKTQYMELIIMLLHATDIYSENILIISCYV